MQTPKRFSSYSQRKVGMRERQTTGSTQTACNPDLPPASLVALAKSLNLFEFLHFKRYGLPVQMAYTCNPSYSGGRDQEDHGSKPALDK
jgi:hypothetical protein